MKDDGLPHLEEQLNEDLIKLLAEPWGRRIAFYLTNNLADVEMSTFDPTIRDGICTAMHMARSEGVRGVGAVLTKRLRKADSRGYMTALSDGMRNRDMRVQQSKREKQR